MNNTRGIVSNCQGAAISDRIVSFVLSKPGGPSTTSNADCTNKRFNKRTAPGEILEPFFGKPELSQNQKCILGPIVIAHRARLVYPSLVVWMPLSVSVILFDEPK